MVAPLRETIVGSVSLREAKHYEGFFRTPVEATVRVELSV
jgi:hypothetical protein